MRITDEHQTTNKMSIFRHVGVARRERKFQQWGEKRFSNFPTRAGVVGAASQTPASPCYVTHFSEVQTTSNKLDEGRLGPDVWRRLRLRQCRNRSRLAKISSGRELLTVTERSVRSVDSWKFQASCHPIKVSLRIRVGVVCTTEHASDIPSATFWYLLTPAIRTTMIFTTRRRFASRKSPSRINIVALASSSLLACNGS